MRQSLVLVSTGLAIFILGSASTWPIQAQTLPSSNHDSAIKASAIDDRVHSGTGGGGEGGSHGTKSGNGGGGGGGTGPDKPK
jgi:hypothetical protein